jgi:hypothetical protein
MGELSDAIREHLELKRRRGADPAEVAREEREALAPVTRSHPVVVAPAQEREPLQASDNGAASAPAHPAHEHAAAPEEADAPEEDLGEATQEFRVEWADSADDWLDEVQD